MSDQPAAHPDVRLRPGEQIVRIEHLDIAAPTTPLSTLQVLRSLTRAGPGRRPGDDRPSMAATVDAANAGHDELRLYEVLFGRDSLVVAWMLADRYPRLTLTTVRALAAHQGTTFDPASEQEPGRIPHEVRDPSDPIAARLTADRGWGWPYYGSVDATPLFVSALARAVRSDRSVLRQEVSRNDGRTVTLAQVAADATRWLLRRLESPSGFVESTPAHAGALPNQVWKDSPDSYMHVDGTLASTGCIASVEVVGYAYEALLDGAWLAEADAEADTDDEADWPASAASLRESADLLRRRLVDRMWLPDLGFFALGTDRDADGHGRPLRVRASNMGHLLATGILDGPAMRSFREATGRALCDPSMLTHAGLRTLSRNEIAFRPTGYHTGSVWPFDTYVAAMGLHRAGLHGAAWVLMDRVLGVVEATRMAPELVVGDDGDVRIATDVVDVVDAEGRQLRVMQPPQLLQAWTTAAAVAAKHARGLAALGRAGAPQRTSSGATAVLDAELLATMGHWA